MRVGTPRFGPPGCNEALTGIQPRNRTSLKGDPMNRHAYVALALAALLAVTGAARAEEKSAEDIVLSLEREWAKRFAESDVDWIVAAHAPDGRQFPPGAPPVVGLEAIRASWQGMADTKGFKLSWEPTQAFVSESGDMAWDYGTGRQTSPDGVIVEVKYVVIWHRVDGQWKVMMDMFSPNE